MSSAQQPAPPAPQAPAPQAPSSVLTLSVESKAYQAGADMQIKGKGFGAKKGSSILTVGGHVPEIVSWSEELIVVRVPTTLSESAARALIVSVGDKRGVTEFKMQSDAE